MQEIARSVLGQELADGYYLDFDSRQIDWDAWALPYTAVITQRQMRNVPRVTEFRISGKAEILMSLIETFTSHMARHRTYVGNVELQLALHALILLRFEPAGDSIGDEILPMFKEMIEFQRKALCDSAGSLGDFEAIMERAVKRFKNLQTPVIGGNLVYPPGKTMGIDKTTNW